MRYVGQASINGVMARNIKDNGLIIKCMERANFGGQMAKSILETS
jgi:hypothetical protein